VGVNAVLPRPDIAQAGSGLTGPDRQRSGPIKAAGLWLSQACLTRLVYCLPRAVLDSGAHYCIFVLWV
jgi:hypothetical protein